MSEAEGSNQEDLRKKLIQRSVEDEDLRQKLLLDPKGTVEQELGAKVPEGIEVRAVEETPETIYLVLPPKAVTSPQLSDQELETVAGGWAIHSSDCTSGGPTCQPPPECI